MMKSKMNLIQVAPLAGAWIEMPICSINWLIVSVAPLAGAWIEISHVAKVGALKKVAPLAGAWIEIIGLYSNVVVLYSRSPRGSVD